MSSAPVGSEDELSPDDRKRLEEAYGRLRDAAGAYEPFMGRQLQAGEPVPIHDLGAMAAAQARVEAADEELWRLREDLLGWHRPAGMPAASLVPEWFSDEDRIYDDVDVESRR